jgi:hypothetical protein
MTTDSWWLGLNQSHCRQHLRSRTGVFDRRIARRLKQTDYALKLGIVGSARNRIDVGAELLHPCLREDDFVIGGLQPSHGLTFHPNEAS